ncbi:hypothetical protein PS685_04272 [Pseudomonas fluorescens]|uniref:Uncharacterized protein n=1 Tax=Pseudomonas fluorescens TaxID=294 RepID=A0A5E6ZB58_PSEFL|nr:hypothetical protein PS685_04272 [Pseudomonas fluorescens]
MYRAGNQGHTGAGFHCCFSQGEAHFSGAVVGDVAHRVDVFLGRACGDQHVLAGQHLTLKTLGGAAHQIIRFEHAAKAHVATGLASGGRAKHAQAAAFEQPGIGLGGRVAPHGLVHRRSDGNRGIRGEHQGGQQVIGQALGKAGNQVSGCRCNQYQVGPLGQLDMPHGRFSRRVEQIQMNGVPGQRLHGQRRDEFAAATGHDNPYFRALVQ